MNTVEKIAEVLSNKALQPRIATCPIMADTVKLLAEHGMKATENELREVLAQMIKAASVELSEEDPEQVTGGFGVAMMPLFVLGDVAKRMTMGFSEGESGTSTYTA